ncbi:hypothetical protein E8E13_003450 [Curvularia kusanoi]|uniref:IgE-binding protein n=1 Tax=Curvularia kusanoi TaxID=90978 RepID=A0A9P4T4U4_CURKU|nr:hypothetical protein E8E13_003450 [Curvularia kusanoi]
MKYALAIAGLVAGALAGGECAAPAPSSTPTPAPGSSYFGVISSRSASPIHLLPLQARGGKFYLGGKPSSYCPSNLPAGACPAGTETVLAGGDKTLSLGVVVPGGQQIFVAPDGTLGYTQPHSVSMPAGAIVDQFSKTAPGANGLGTLSFETGFVACPTTDNGYQVFGQTEGFKAAADCLGFSALTSAADGPGAWEY